VQAAGFLFYYKMPFLHKERNSLSRNICTFHFFQSVYGVTFPSSYFVGEKYMYLFWFVSYVKLKTWKHIEINLDFSLPSSRLMTCFRSLYNYYSEELRLLTPYIIYKQINIYIRNTSLNLRTCLQLRIMTYIKKDFLSFDREQQLKIMSAWDERTEGNEPHCGNYNTDMVRRIDMEISLIHNMSWDKWWNIY
jgi:hypothetical protein